MPITTSSWAKLGHNKHLYHIMANKPNNPSFETKAQGNDYAPRKVAAKPSENRTYPLGKMNFILMAVCLLMIVIGFALMTGSANVGDQFNYSIFESSRTVIGPMIAFAGFVLMAFAILYRPHSSKTYSEDKNASNAA